MLCWLRMFSRKRKARVLFGLSDIFLAAVGFEAAYQTRAWLQLPHEFFLTVPLKTLVVAFSLFSMVTIGIWLEVYDKLDSAHPRVILRDTARQCAYTALGLIVFEYVLRLDLSRFFLLLFALYTWALLLIFRLTAGRLVGVIRREFAAPHYVMIAGTGERAIAMARALEKSVEYGIRLHGFLTETADGPSEILLEARYEVQPIASLQSILRQQVIDEVIFAVPSESLADRKSVVRERV